MCERTVAVKRLFQPFTRFNLEFESDFIFCLIFWMCYRDFFLTVSLSVERKPILKLLVFALEAFAYLLLLKKIDGTPIILELKTVG